MRDLIEPELRALHMIIRNEPISRSKLTRHLQRYDYIGTDRDKAISSLIELNLIKEFKPKFLIAKSGPRPRTYEATNEGRAFMDAYIAVQDPKRGAI